MSRWAKTPEWLPPALHAVPREQRRGSSPGTALSVFSVMASTHADFRTGRATVPLVDIAEQLGASERAVRRAVRLLEIVGALRVTERGRSNGRVPSTYQLQFDEPEDNAMPVEPTRTSVSANPDIGDRVASRKPSATRTRVSALPGVQSTQRNASQRSGQLPMFNHEGQVADELALQAARRQQWEHHREVTARADSSAKTPMPSCVREALGRAREASG